jgi:hypothetical protein
MNELAAVRAANDTPRLSCFALIPVKAWIDGPGLLA